MMRLNRKVEYALMVLKYMSQKKPGQLSSAKEMCERLNTPFDATSRVLQVMSQYGVLKSEQGAQGGYQIIRNLNRVSFFQLNEMILGSLGVAKCITRENDCELQTNCNIFMPVRMINQKYSEFMKNLNLAEILGLAEAMTTTEQKGESIHVS